MAVNLLVSQDLQTTVKLRKPKWFGHVTPSYGLSKTIMQKTVPEGRKPGRQQIFWKAIRKFVKNEVPRMPSGLKKKD